MGFAQYTGPDGSEKFIDYYDYFVGYAKDISEFNVKPPYPERVKTSDGRTWELKEGTKPNNHQFENLEGKFAKNIYTKKVPYKEKYQPSPVPWRTYLMSSTITGYKARGDLK